MEQLVENEPARGRSVDSRFASLSLCYRTLSRQNVTSVTRIYRNCVLFSFSLLFNVTAHRLSLGDCLPTTARSFPDRTGTSALVFGYNLSTIRIVIGSRLLKQTEETSGSTMLLFSFVNKTAVRETSQIRLFARMSQNCCIKKKASLRLTHAIRRKIKVAKRKKAGSCKI